MTDKQQPPDNEEGLYALVEKAADFVHKRQGNADAPTGLNNTVEEYIDEDKEEK